MEEEEANVLRALQDEKYGQESEEYLKMMYSGKIEETESHTCSPQNACSDPSLP